MCVGVCETRLLGSLAMNPPPAAEIEDFGLPLIGPEFPGYPEKLRAAAEHWMRNRWLPRPEA